VTLKKELLSKEGTNYKKLLGCLINQREIRLINIYIWMIFYPILIIILKKLRGERGNSLKKRIFFPRFRAKKLKIIDLQGISTLLNIKKG
jgi:hypothetical protein